MSEAQTLIYVAVLGLIAGFAMMRGNICSVLATRQIVELNRFTRIKAFAYSIAWSIAVMFPLIWMKVEGFKLYPHYELSYMAALAGLIYGVGAFVNGACVFGVCSRAVAGELHFLFALPGIAFGAMLTSDAGVGPPKAAPAPAMLIVPTAISIIILVVAILLSIVSAAGIWRAYFRPGMGAIAIVKAQRWRSSLAMAVLGVSGALLFASGHIWNFPVFLRQVGNWFAGRPYNFSMPLIVGTVALYGGALVSVLTGGRFVWQWPDLRVNLRSFVGGALMGFGASMVPGGNDVMLLYAVPALAPNAIVAYASFIATLILLALVAKRLREEQRLP
jgi:hypothetical protein